MKLAAIAPAAESLSESCCAGVTGVRLAEVKSEVHSVTEIESNVGPGGGKEIRLAMHASLANRPLGRWSITDSYIILFGRNR